MKRITYNYLKPQFYYGRLLTFFLVISFFLGFTLSGFSFYPFFEYFFRVIVIFFLVILLAVLIEFRFRGDYMSPLEIFDLEFFCNQLLFSASRNDIIEDKYVNKYDSITRKKFWEVFGRSAHSFFLSSIRKHGETYVITFIDDRKYFAFFFIRFLIRHPFYRVYIRKGRKGFRVVRIE